MMIGGCIFSTVYTMTAELYKKTQRTTNSGQIEYKWLKDITYGESGIIPCIVMPFKSNSFTRQGTGEQFSNTYRSYDYLKLNSKFNIPKGYQVANIRGKNGELIYKELMLKNSPGTWFNTQGSSPIIDPFGDITEYQTLISRAESQGGL